MPDFPVADVSGAISKAVSSMVPPRAYIFMVALLPGFFFETGILLANPALFCELAARAQDGLGLGRWGTLGLALILAFVVGNAFILWVILVQRLLGYFYRLWSYIREEICAGPIRRISGWLSNKPKWAKRRWVNDLALYTHVRISETEDDEGARKLWAIFARRLLTEKYGIELKALEQEEWNALYWTLGTLTMADLRGSMTMVVFEATGWSGLAAIPIASQLRNRYYVALSVFLILVGLLHDWWVATGLSNYRILGFLKIRSLLREFQNLPNQEKPLIAPKPSSEVASSED